MSELDDKPNFVPHTFQASCTLFAILRFNTLNAFARSFKLFSRAIASFFETYAS